MDWHWLLLLALAALSAVVLLLAGCTEELPAAATAEPEAPSAPPTGLDDVAWGERLFADHGCVACHSLHGARGIGGAVDHLWRRPRRLTTGDVVLADAHYIRESIVDPAAAIVEGFTPTMPSDYGTRLSEAQVDALVAYIQSLE